MTKILGTSPKKGATLPTVKIYTGRWPPAFLATILLTTDFFDLWPRLGTEALGGPVREWVHIVEARRAEHSKDYRNNTPVL